MRKYDKPNLETELIETNDAVLASGLSVDENHNTGDGPFVDM